MTTTKVPQTPEERALSNVIDFAAYRAKRDKRRQRRDPLAQLRTDYASRGPATDVVENLRRAAELAALLIAAGNGESRGELVRAPARRTL